MHFRLLGNRVWLPIFKKLSSNKFEYPPTLSKVLFSKRAQRPLWALPSLLRMLRPLQVLSGRTIGNAPLRWCFSDHRYCSTLLYHQILKSEVQLSQKHFYKREGSLKSICFRHQCGKQSLSLSLLYTVQTSSTVYLWTATSSLYPQT